MGERFVDAALPMTADGRAYISDEMVAENPGLLQMIHRQSNFWTRDYCRRAWIAPAQKEESRG